MNATQETTVGFEVYDKDTGARCWVCKKRTDAERLAARLNADHSPIETKNHGVREIRYEWKS